MSHLSVDAEEGSVPYRTEPAGGQTVILSQLLVTYNGGDDGGGRGSAGEWSLRPCRYTRPSENYISQSAKNCTCE